MLLVFNRSLRNISDAELKANTSSEAMPHKDDILKYMKSFDKTAFTSAPVVDAFTGEKFEEANDARSDGVYTWYESQIYHFEKYNLKLNDDFIQHVLSRI